MEEINANVVQLEGPDVERVLKKIRKNQGYKPGTVREDSNRCLCKSFREQFSGVCECGVYEKTPIDFIVYSSQTTNSRRNEQMRTMLRKLGKAFKERHDIPYDIDDDELPALEQPDGRFLSYFPAITQLVEMAERKQELDRIFKVKE